MNAVASRPVTFRPELLTAKGHPKSETTITREVQTFASEFEKKILTGAYQSVYRSGGETIVKTTKTKGSLRDITVPAPVIALARQWKSEQAQGRLGHSNTSTTLNIYAEYLNELDRSASDKLDNLLLCR